MADPLVVAFGDAVVQHSNASILSRDFFEASKEEARKTVLKGNLHDSQIRELELKLWDLCILLIDNNISGSVPPEIVQKWLVANLESPTRPHSLQPAQWNYSLDTSMDVDSTNGFANGNSNNEKKIESEEAFFRYAFELVLRGEQEAAVEVAQETKNWLAKMVLSAGNDVKSQKMLHDSCFELSKSAKGPCERAFYGLLSGNVSASSQLCTSWEEMLLAYTLSGTALSEFELNQLSEDDEIMCFRKVVLAVLNGRVNEFVDKLVESTPPNPSTLGSEWHYPWFVRVLVHLQILISSSSASSSASGASAATAEVSNALLVLYIEHQLSRDSLFQFVPRYVELLTEPNQVSIYGKILYAITDESTQEEQLRLARKYPRINIEAVVRHTIELSFLNYDSSLEGVQHFCGALKWLLSAQKVSQSADLLSITCPALIRAFSVLLGDNQEEGAILLSKLFSLRELKLAEVIDGEGIASKYYNGDAAAVQFQLLEQYYTLVSALADLIEFKRYGGIDSGYLGARAVYDSVDASLGFGVDGLDSKQISAEENEHISQIRAQWLPVVVNRYLEALDPSQSGCAMKLATRIADEDQKLYLLFDPSLMEKLVKPLLDLLELPQAGN